MLRNFLTSTRKQTTIFNSSLHSEYRTIQSLPLENFYWNIKILDLYLFLVRRVRCETLGRLDEIKTENEAKRKVQIISWQNPLPAQTNNKSNLS
jgi:hypothetical protein